MRLTRAMLEAELAAARARIAELELQLADSRDWCRELMRAAEAANAADDGLIENLSMQVESLQTELLITQDDISYTEQVVVEKDNRIHDLTVELLRPPFNEVQ